MARSFSEREKENIRKSLSDICKQNWTQYGYKKTSVDEICKQAGISKGAFYLFFESKEALFCEVLCSVQREICEMAAAAMKEEKGKSGVVKALKLIYRAYDKNSFLYGSDTTDYTILMNKLSEEQAKEMEQAGELSRQLFSSHPALKLKGDVNMAISVIYSLIMNIKNKDILPKNHLEVFDFMADHLIDTLYE
ncbi:TetR/AcrR family transcriptional regulator [Bariatricus massiliensis]|uniref:TetR/AcrR family transcriptional regulator n=1 Tax=Bariatricus massiliensis TaxID=1745713 RepID=A0ABS8DJ85_9FIRM|nr:TetR/AcrR family transcriptional regulator [Bariatricus massiliensis]MCB7305014.1 TetR/AcrR family transcriptional regulator [Bariatricus massiliensis]MCB7375645.1 TetR/AcrR family transcriptional regulator [Bariatricus massiliensis]MCB7388234.1 TetR/AcrR family transcriptional regulator [Bariatricus massiliensis]MCB7412330.1 TetR/AcrR family transcriptional regulator [Bariatricus massiliensis]MCQ5254688.1 TetR/AcrR family transcriptional regulator [Bariatricus massiliensis]